MLIVEGPDGVGKTTLCKKLLAGLPGYVYSHFTRLPRGFDYHWGYADRVSRYIVQDRFHLSEIIYSAARGEDTPLTPELYRLVDARLRLAGAYTLLVTADRRVLEPRWGTGQMYSLERTLAAADFFAGLPANYPGYCLDIDYHHHCTAGGPYVTDAVVDRVLTEYKARQSLVTRLAGCRPATL